MALINWEDNLSVNVSEIDEQHKKLIWLINELNDAMRERKANEILGEIIDGLINYTGTHFMTEENYFEDFDYLDAPSHKREHNAFVKKVKDFKEGFDDGRMMLSIEVIDFLKDWLIKHIQGTDKKYSELFNEKGLS